MAAITDLRPKYQKPREDRVWVWYLTFSTFAGADYKQNWALLFSLGLPSIAIEPRRVTQDGLTKDLWDEMHKKMNA